MKVLHEKKKWYCGEVLENICFVFFNRKKIKLSG